MDDLTRALKRIRLRMLAQSFAQKFSATALAFGGGAVILLALRSLLGSGLAGEWPFFFGTILLVASVWTLATAPSLPTTAAVIDARAQTRDRFATALSFTRGAERGIWTKIAVNECTQFVASFDARPFTRLRVPREARWLIVPAIAAGLLRWHAQLAEQKSAPDPLAQHALFEKADALEAMAKQIDAANSETKSDELKKIAAEIRKTKTHLRDDAKNTGDAGQAALGELSALQDALEKMRALSPELAALAEALQKANAEGAEALRRGDLERAAAEIEKQSDAAERIAQALKQTNPESPSNVARAMSQLAQASGTDAERALRQLAAALRQQARNGAGGEALRQTLGALQEMKFGQTSRPLSLKSEVGKNNGEGKVTTENFDSKNAQMTQLVSSVPSGQAGTEHDEGTTETPFGKERGRIATERAQVELAGVLGQGESLQKLITTHGDESKSALRYRQLFNAMSPAAADAVWQENIPLGSRFFVKRYFESIRPPE